MRERKELMMILAAILMPAANGKVSNALNLAEGLAEEADRRWPEPVALDPDFQKLMDDERQRREAAIAPTPEGGSTSA